MRKVLKKRQIMEITGLSRSTLYREERAGRFPARVLISVKRVGWFQDEIEAWLESRVRFNERK